MNKSIFLDIYRLLFSHYGPQRWWPADSFLEMLVGAVLTQNTNWKNVEKALESLKQAEMLSLEALSAVSMDELAQLIRPAGYYNLKSKRLKNLLRLIADEYGGDLQKLQDDDLQSSRKKLLGVKGIGEETADSILLYGCSHPIFVIDTYTHRVFSRHNLVEEESTYADMQQSFMDSLPSNAQLFNEYHALIVRTAKDYCRKSKPLCDACPLNSV